MLSITSLHPFNNYIKKLIPFVKGKFAIYLGEIAKKTGFKDSRVRGAKCKSQKNRSQKCRSAKVRNAEAKKGGEDSAPRRVRLWRKGFEGPRSNE